MNKIIEEVKRLASANWDLIEYFFRMKNYSNPRTLELYWKAFRRFCDFPPFKVKNFKEWTKEDIVNLSFWLSKQKNKSSRKDNNGFLSDTSMKNYLAALKVLFNALELSTARYIKLKTIKTKVKAKDLITKEELRKAISCCTNYRDKAIIGFYYDTMCRLTEALKIRFSDIVYDKEHEVFEVNIRSETTITIQ